MMTNLNENISVAVYQDPGLPEYANNPFISALPLIKDRDAAIKCMEIMPTFDEREINLPPHIRIHAIQRVINNFFQPMAEHILLEQRFSILIRQSYVGRNPSTSAYKKHLNNGYDRIVNKDINLTVRKDAVSTATGFSIVGPSGCGKTSAVLRSLSGYPTAIFHPDLHIIQIPWLKLECPRNGSLTELCFNFFRAVDNHIGTEYFGRYCKPRVGVDSLIAEMAHIAEKRHHLTDLTMKIIGFDEDSSSISDASGFIALLDKHDCIAASWSFAKLIDHWKRKHSQAVYVPCISRNNPSTGLKEYHFGNNLELGEGTNFELFLTSMQTGKIFYDPGIKLENASNTSPKIKRRSQFRINHKDINQLYKNYEIL